MNVIIVAPSLDPTQNVSGVSSVVNFIMNNNTGVHYTHFELGRKDRERGGIFRLSSILASYRRWKTLLDKDRDSLIHYSFPLSAPSILRDPLFMRYALRQKRKMVIHVHGGVYLTSPEIPLVLKKILRWVFSWNVPFIVLSETEVKILKERFGAKHVISLPNSVDMQDAESFVRKIGQQPLTLGYLGRIEPNKGMNELLQACRSLKEEGISFRLRLAGKETDGYSVLTVFQQELGNYFEYCGVVSGKCKCDFLRRLDVFVLPSYFEGLPMSLLECMSYGSVPVVTSVGSIPTVVSNEENGLLVPPKNPESVANAIRRLNSDRLLVQRLGEKARETAFQNFSPKNYIEKLNGIYHSLFYE